MDFDQNIVDSLRDMREAINKNHIEVVQRLSRVEVAQSPIPDLAKRVGSLEIWQSRIAGALALLGTLFTAATAYAVHRLR